MFYLMHAQQVNHIVTAPPGLFHGPTEDKIYYVKLLDIMLTFFVFKRYVMSQSDFA